MKSEAIKARIERFRELFKAVIYSILAIVTGIVTTIHNILIHKIPVYMVSVAGIGLIVFFLLLLIGRSIWEKFEELEKELENAD